MTRDEAINYLGVYVMLGRAAVMSDPGAQQINNLTMQAIEILLNEVKTNDEKLKNIYGIENK